MRRLLAPAFVMTAAAACSKTPVQPGAPDADDVRFRTNNPPAIVDLDASGATTTAKVAHRKRTRSKDASVRDRNDGTRAGNPHFPALNPKDDKGRMITTASNDSCWVEIPPTKPPTSVTGAGARESEEVDCPPAMDDPAWDDCQAASLVIDETSQKCFCMPGWGNPPPPEYLVKCPANAKDALKKKER